MSGIILGLLLSLSCSKDETDDQKPVINLVSPAEMDEFLPGTTIPFEATFTDDKSLNQFKINIHFDDGHDHKSVIGHYDAWNYEFVGQLSGTAQEINMEIDIPEELTHGAYHFLVFCTDEVGNESFVAIDIHIEDDHD